MRELNPFTRRKYRVVVSIFLRFRPQILQETRSDSTEYWPHRSRIIIGDPVPGWTVRPWERRNSRHLLPTVVRLRTSCLRILSAPARLFFHAKDTRSNFRNLSSRGDCPLLILLQYAHILLCLNANFKFKFYFT